MKIFTFIVRSSYGFGDLMFASRLANSLLSKLSDVSIFFVVRNLQDEKSLVLLDVNHDIKMVRSLKEISQKIDLLIIGPGISAITDEKEYIETNNTKVWLLSEYDYFSHYERILNELEAVTSNVILTKSGFSRTSNGILLIDQMFPDQTKSTLIEQISHPYLKKEVVNTFEKRTLSFAYCSLLPCGDIPLLHAAYHYASGSEKGLDLILISSATDSLFYNDPDEYMVWILKELKPAWGYTKVSLINMEDGHISSRSIKGSHQIHSEKEFRIFVEKKINNKDVQIFLNITDSLCTGTGDQTITEFLSSSKDNPFYYLITGVHHKDFLLDNLCMLIEPLKLAVKHMSSMHYEQAGAALYQGKNAFVDFKITVRKQFNLVENILPKINQALSEETNQSLWSPASWVNNIYSYGVSLFQFWRTPSNTTQSNTSQDRSIKGSSRKRIHAEEGQLDSVKKTKVFPN